MARTKSKPTKSKPTKSSNINPAITPEGQEARMITLAVDLAEQQLREGTASSQIITHYLKLATERERLEREKLRGDIELTKAKTEATQSAKRIEEMYSEAIKSMRSYAGVSDDEDIQSDDYDADVY